MASNAQVVLTPADEDWLADEAPRSSVTASAAVTAAGLLELLATKLELTADVTVDDIRPDIVLETQ